MKQKAEEKIKAKLDREYESDNNDRKLQELKTLI